MTEPFWASGSSPVNGDNTGLFTWQKEREDPGANVQKVLEQCPAQVKGDLYSRSPAL